MIRFVPLSEKTRDWLGLTLHHQLAGLDPSSSASLLPQPSSVRLHQKELGKSCNYLHKEHSNCISWQRLSNYHHNKHPVYISPFLELDLFNLRSWLYKEWLVRPYHKNNSIVFAQSWLMTYFHAVWVRMYCRICPPEDWFNPFLLRNWHCFYSLHHRKKGLKARLS